MAATDPQPPVVCDAGPLIHLDEIECLPLLSDFPKVLVPQAVWDEVNKYRANALRPTTFQIQKVEPTQALTPELEALSRLLALHRGEREALQIALSQPGCVVLTDDTAARLASRNLGLAAHGTLGILVRAIRRKQKTKNEVISLLRSLPARSTLHIRPALLAEIIRDVEQS